MLIPQNEREAIRHSISSDGDSFRQPRQDELKILQIRATLLISEQLSELMEQLDWYEKIRMERSL